MSDTDNFWQFVGCVTCVWIFACVVLFLIAVIGTAILFIAAFTV